MSRFEKVIMDKMKGRYTLEELYMLLESIDSKLYDVKQCELSKAMRLHKLSEQSAAIKTANGLQTAQSIIGDMKEQLWYHIDEQKRQQQNEDSKDEEYIIKATANYVDCDRATIKQIEETAYKLLCIVSQKTGRNFLSFHDNRGLTFRITPDDEFEATKKEVACEHVKVETLGRELTLNGQEAYFRASTLNLDYVIIDNTLYLGLDWYDKVIKDVYTEFKSHEEVVARAEQIVAANAAFELVVRRKYEHYQILVFVKEGFGYVVLHQYGQTTYVQFVWEELEKEQIEQLQRMDLEDKCKEGIRTYREYLLQGEPERYANFVWKQDRFANEKTGLRDEDICLNCGCSR